MCFMHEAAGVNQDLGMNGRGKLGSERKCQDTSFIRSKSSDLDLS